MPDELASALDLYGARLVTALATFHQVSARTTGKTALIAALAKTLADPAQIQAQWKALSPGQLAVAEAILQRGDRATLRALREHLDRQGVIDKSRSPSADGYGRVKVADPHARNSRRLEDLLAGLMLRGLVFAAAPADNPYPDSPGFEPPKVDFDHLPPAVRVPEAVRRHLPAVPLLPGPANLRPVEAAPTQAGSARTFQRDLYLYWSYIRDHGVRLTQKDEVQKTDLKKLSAVLLVRETLGKGEGEGEHPRLRFLRQTLMALNLLVYSSTGALVPAPTAADFFALDGAARVQRTFEAWRQTDLFNELALLPKDVLPSRADSAVLTAPAPVIQARQAVLRALAGVSAPFATAVPVAATAVPVAAAAVQVAAAAVPVAGDVWLPLDGLCTWLREDDYEFLLPRTVRRAGLGSYAPAPPYSPGTNALGVDFPYILNEADGWNKVEANFIRGVVTGPLYWLGLANLGAAAKTNGAGKPSAPEVDAFCLTPLGRWVLGLGPRPEIPEGGGRVIVQPNLHIVALDPVNDGLLVALDAFAERLTAERAVEYRLTRASVYAGQQAGWSAERIRAFLSEHTGAELPGNVARTLEEWQAQHERIVLRPSVILAHGPAAIFDALAKDPAAAELLAARPLPDVALLKDPTAVADLVSALRERDLLPLVAAGPAVPPNSIQADELGFLRFATPRPSLYLHGHLAAFADPAGPDAYQISQDTVARAQRAGFTAADIIARLAVVHRGPAPAALLRRIRAWTKHYGDAALESFVLLQVRDTATLAELRADPELAPLLHDFTPAPGKALAHVDPADLPRLRALLAERGVGLKDELE